MRTSWPENADAPAPPAASPAAIRQQLEKIVASGPFRNSKRYPALLRYVVEKTLAGAGPELKERNIGIDVFNREPAYDLGLDPIVRVAAGEVRKRLAQYYQEKEHRNELRIDIPLGSYQPEFTPAEQTPETIPPSPSTPVLPPKQFEDPARRWRSGPLVFASLGLLCFAGLCLLWILNRPSALDRFWSPVISQGNPILLCIGRAGLKDDAGPDPANIDANYRQVAGWDAETMARVASLIGSKGGSLRLLREDQATFSDFQQSPAVLIGAYNDQWTLELMQKMRYTFQRSGRVQWIADRDRPAFQDWKVDLNRLDGQGKLIIGEDFAIISRVANPRTGSISVTVSGLWGYGTLAAGRFLTDPKYLNDLAKQAPSGWSKRNMEIVIGTEVIQGSPGPPTVLAAAYW